MLLGSSVTLSLVRVTMAYMTISFRYVQLAINMISREMGCVLSWEKGKTVYVLSWEMECVCCQGNVGVCVVRGKGICVLIFQVHLTGQERLSGDPPGQ